MAFSDAALTLNPPRPSLPRVNGADRLSTGQLPGPAPSPRAAGRVATINIAGLLGLPLLAQLVVTIRAEPFDGLICAIGIFLALTAYGVGVIALRVGWGRLSQDEHTQQALRRCGERVEALCLRGYARTGAWCRRRPLATLWLAALAGVLLSAYPVIFLGKSFVGPAITGTPLLYDRLPTLPGSTEKRYVWRNGSDVGAGMLASFPYSAVERRTLFEDGEFPLWNRYNGAGVPLLGQGQSMIGDPLNGLVILAGGSAWAWDLKFLLAKLLFAAGIGLAVRGINGGRLAAAAVLAFGACFLGFFIYRFNHPAYFSVCYAPWILVAWLRLGRAADRRRLTPLGLLVLADWCELCSGTAKEACILLLVLNAAGALSLALSGALPWRRRGARLLLAAWTSGGVLLLSAPLWLTFLDALRTAWTNYTEPGALQTQPGTLAGLFDDIFYRQYNHMARVYSPALNFLVLLGVGLAAANWRGVMRRGPLAALAAGALGTGALVFGVVPPAWIERVPFLGNINHIDTTFSCPLIVLLTVVAGGGLQPMLGRLRARDWAMDVWGAVGVLVLIVALFLGTAQARQGTDHAPVPLAHSPPFFWGYLATLAVAFTALPFLWRRLCLDRGATAPGLLPWVVLCLAALLWRGGLHSPAVAGPDLYVIYPPPRPDFSVPSAAVEQVRTMARDEPGRTAGFNDNLVPGFGAALGLEMTSGPDALQNRDVHALLVAAQMPLIYGFSMRITRQDLDGWRPLYDALNLRYFLDLPPDARQPPAPLPPGLRLVRRSDMDVYVNDAAWPRAFFTDALAPCGSGADFLALLVHGDGRPFAAADTADAAAPPGLLALARRGGAGRAMIPATEYRLTGNSTAFRVRVPGPGVVALLEGFQPGDTRVSVNGRSVPCFRVNAAFSGVYFDRAGDYTVRFHYWPRLLTPALWLAAVGAGLFGLTAWRLRRGAAGEPPVLRSENHHDLELGGIQTACRAMAKR